MNILRMTLIILLFCNYVIYSISPETLYGKAVELYDDGKFEKSVEHLKIILEDYPENNWADASCFLIGDCYIKTGDNIKARLYFNLVLSNYSDSPLVGDAYFFISKTYEIEKDYMKMAECLKYFIVNFPDSYWINEAQKNFLYYSEQGKFDLDEVNFKVAQGYIENMENENSLKLLEEIINESKNSDNIYKASLKVAKIYYYKQNFKLCSDFFEKIYNKVEISSEDNIIYADSLYNISDYKKAFSVYKDILSKDNISKKSLQKTLYSLGDILLHLERKEEALVYLKRLNKEFPDSDYSNEVNSMLNNVLRKEPVRINIVKKDERKELENLKNKIMSYREEKTEDKLENLKKNIEDKKKSILEKKNEKEKLVIKVNTFQNLWDEAEIFQNERNYFDALMKYSEALIMQPELKELYFRVAFLYNQMKDPENAKINIDKYFELGGNNKEAFYLNSFLLFKMNRFEESINSYRDVMETITDKIEKEEVRLAIQRLQMAF
ncbi:MAG: tetratricopeptide repeat protein [Candidatus Muirbacterium halophilum]|nr:tetratricopeptide repeat protein [Candidatus Muirbacterium halophilum]MCK9476988.1 tetratricopeptide repeat protein [Candidatus Muirbacterium halophilum]